MPREFATPMKIKVTEEHINNGKRKSRGCCPIALALKDQFGDDCDPRVNDLYIFIGSHPEPYYQAEWFVSAFIKRFDDGEWCPPIEFDLMPLIRPYHV